MKYLFTILIGYLCGCLNASYIIAKIKGHDLKKEGTYNAGASNVGFVIGIKWALIAGIIDIIKAVVAYKICANLFENVIYGQIAGAMAIIGHNHPFYLHFNGGKGFASLMGFLTAYNFKIALILIAIHLIAIFTTKHMVMGSFAVMFFAIVIVLILKDWSFALILFIVVVCMLPRHASNIRNLINGCEPKLSDAKR